MDLLDRLEPDAVFGAAYQWLRRRRRDYSDHAEVWSFRHMSTCCTVSTGLCRYGGRHNRPYTDPLTRRRLDRHTQIADEAAATRRIRHRSERPLSRGLIPPIDLNTLLDMV